MSRRRGIFDGLPIPADKSYLKEGLSRIDESWAAARFDSLPHVVHILTSKDREGEIQFLKEQSDLIEDVVDEVVHAYHHGFNKAIQNYSQILRLFSESAESIAGLKGEMEETKKLLGRKNKHLGQLWYRSLTLHHVLSLLDQIEDVAKVPARIENLIAEKQLYAAVQLHVQSVLILEREGLQAVGALQDVRSDLTKLRGVLFYKILDELHGHLYNNGEYSSATLCLVDSEEVPTSTSTASGRLENSMQPFSRRTRLIKGDNHITGLVDGFPKVSSVDGGSSFDGPDDNSLDMSESDGQTPEGFENLRSFSREIPIFLSCATPDEFLESMIKADAPLNVKYLRTLVQCLSMLGKVAAAGAVIWFNSCHTINYRHILKEKRNRSSKVDVSSGFTFFLRQGLNPRISFFLGRGRREYLVPLYRTSSLVLGLALAFVLIFSCPLYLHRRKMGIKKNRRGHHFFFLS